MVKKIKEALGGEESGKTVTCLGLTFKAETDDMREAQTLTILPALTEKGVNVQVHDPKGMEEARKIMPELQYCDDPYSACQNSDALVIMTEWNEYKALDLEKIKSVMKTPVFIDLRNLYDPETVKEKGFKYFGVGRN